MPSMEPEVRIVVLDLDTADLKKHTDVQALYDRIQAMSLTRFVIYTPAGGVHLFYRLEEGQEAPNGIHPRPEYPGLDLRSPAIEVGIATYGGDATYPKGEKKGVPDGFVGYYRLAPYGEYDAIPPISDQLLEWLKAGDKVILPESTTDDDASVTNNAFSRLPADQQARVVQEALGVVLSKWTADHNYEQWTRMWMAAHAASNGDEAVLRMIMDHGNVRWSDGIRGKTKFLKSWRTHETKRGGVTAATLFYMAAEAGWMQQSKADIVDFDVRINVKHVSEWIEAAEELPHHVLLTSQTGSGKTYGLKALWTKLGEPRTVIFVPSIKLAVDMASTLRDDLGLPAVAYRDEDTLEQLPVEELVKAKVLVTTLQTFSRRVYAEGHQQMAGYGLVYIEECDQLLQQFSKALGDNASHVTQEQADLGFKVLRDAFAETPYVWGVDATMTMVSINCFAALSADAKTVLNEYLTEKPTVHFLDSRMGAYGLIYQSLISGKSVVVPCDTKNEAESVADAMQRLGAVSEDDVLAVTASTGETDERVTRFAKNANEEAPKYRLLTYNSAMASGVSVTSFTPDVIVQMVSGYLTPRTNLQILNRYRKQGDVYCYYNGKKELVLLEKTEQVLDSAKERAQVEADQLLLPLADRSDLAKLRDTLRALSMLDEAAQRRAPQWFYRRLLNQDGREVSQPQHGNVISRVEDAVEKTREERATRRERLAAGWRDVPPEHDRRKMPKNYTPDQVRMSLTHQWIKDTLNDNVPYNVPAEHVYEVVKRLHKKIGALTSFVFQHKMVRDMERSLANRERAYLSMSAGVSRTVLAAMLRYLFETPEETLTYDILKGRAMPFIRVIEENKRLYAAVVRNPEKSMKTLREKNESDQTYAVALAKAISSSVGLKIGKKKDEGYYIANLREVLDFLSWKYMGEKIDLQFTKATVEQQQQYRREVQHLYKDLEGDELDAFLSRLVALPLEVALSVGGF